MLQKYGAFRAFVQMYDKKSVFRAKKQQRALIFHRITENKELAAGPQGFFCLKKVLEEIPCFC